MCIYVVMAGIDIVYVSAVSSDEQVIRHNEVCYVLCHFPLSERYSSGWGVVGAVVISSLKIPDPIVIDN